MRENLNIAADILDYWFTIEFLGQDSFDMSTGASACLREIKKHKKDIGLKKSNRKQIFDFVELESDKQLYDAIKEEANNCEMATWGNITVYLGKIKREDCILSLADCLNVKELERPEKSYDDIVVASFQLSPNGNYIAKSLSLSTIIWSLSKLQKASANKISELLSTAEYMKDVEDLEKNYFKIKDNLMSECTTEEKKGMPVFSEESVTVEGIKTIYDKLKLDYLDRYIKKNNEADKNQWNYCGIKVQLFKDDKSKEKYDEDNYQGLSHDYFSNDLKMVKDTASMGNISGTGMWMNLLHYINAPTNSQKKWKRRNLIHPKGKDELLLFLQEVLNIRNAPLGKWPSRYMPALMQQVAVNFATSDGKEGVFRENSTIFSVNGPPGTGKTTLLKEIVSGNIVEKAKLLASYENPDDAFEKNKFVHGEKVNGSYSQYHPAWYSFRDDSINDYSVLIASCNNAAVENITKELPMEDGIQNSLQPSNKDCEAMTQQLQEVAELFSVEKSTQKERLYTKQSDMYGEYNEVYFTGYAKQLFGDGAWGMVAAPLGKKANIKEFYYNVLNPLRWDFYPNNSAIDQRRTKYIKVREQFKNQQKKVEELQKKLAAYGEIAESTKRCQLDSKQNIANLNRQIKEIEAKQVEVIKKIKTETVHLENLQSAVEEVKNVVKGISSDKEKLDNEKETISICIIENQKNILDVEKSVSLIARLFKTNKYKAAMDLVGSFRKQLEKFKQKELSCNNKIEKITLLLAQTQEELKSEEQKQSLKNQEISQLIAEKQSYNSKIEKYNSKLQQIIQLLKKKVDQYNQKINEFKGAGDTNTGLVIDDQFIEKLLSSDEKESTIAHVGNPWTTDFYNREREKLLYYSLQVCKEFILSSKSCRENFVLLSQYWGLETGDEKERIAFHKHDKEAMIGSLYQTLFLLIPAISSTFASVGTLLRDVKQPGIIGTLIIDESGQAQPQMAVGALYRSRRAIIVGDPKQVEPVVTDDLELLKKSFTKDVYRPYKDKTLSVQRCADIINPIGTYLDNGTDYPDWVGCPLLVHRRCISPMYDISNKISYGGIMKQQTLLPSEQKQEKFVFTKSQWINISGDENGKKDHYVKKQGEAICNILDIAFSKDEFPSLYIISPFTSVVRGVRREIEQYCRNNKNTVLAKNNQIFDWIYSNIGTVHTFQGKEANEVIFLLGCDSSKGAEGAIKWVNSNIVNVAVTRAKYRLYIIGDGATWRKNQYVGEAKASMDTIALKNIGIIRS